MNVSRKVTQKPKRAQTESALKLKLSVQPIRQETFIPKQEIRRL
eukprot:CAMPEP_0204235582 /NCGR_PEP_ID=MMETSP0361-20130328/91800_1 /ASSEMBLY_ACC=CAM_ASM_000343 /TAXON_ID=268821 /ORGANISM="Scrippsiella Hangoei, Strain SHTV-5" /LENGTH=43 /DNA_ID= /DNA_START= /DNA_END= /DNA_ORIENTATION=